MERSVIVPPSSKAAAIAAPQNRGSLIASINRLLKPRHIAVVGASQTHGKHGNTVVRNLQRWNFPGDIYPVNPSAALVEGLTCYPSIADLPEAADCAFLAIPAVAVVDAVRACAERGVGAVIIGAAGFAESGTEAGIARQAKISEIARTTGIRLFGPNTNGLLNVSDRVAIGYNTSHGEVVAPGTVSFASHSGAFLNSIARRLHQFGSGLSKFIPVGNEADLEMLDFLEYLVDDVDTKVIGLVIEGLSDGARFRSLVARARAQGKPIVALKIGRSVVGIESTMAHATRLAGSARSYDALLTGEGIAVVRSLEALIGGCALLAGRGVITPGEDQRMICSASSGAGGTMIADWAADQEMPFAGDAQGAWEEPLASALAAIPDIKPTRNPIDSSLMSGDWGRLSHVFQAMQDHGLNGPVISFAHVASRPKQDDRLIEALTKRQRDVAAPVCVVAPGGLGESIESRYAENGIPVFHDVSTCFASLQCHYATLPDSWEGLGDPPEGMDKSAQTKIADLMKACPTGADDTAILSEVQSAEILRLSGIPIVSNQIVTCQEDACRAADALGYPVVLKAQLADIAHKAKAGLVATRLHDAQAVKTAFEKLDARMTELGHSAGKGTIIVQPMVASEVELIAGLTYEPPLGHFLVFGLGGIHTEILGDVSLLPTGLSRARIRAQLAASRTGKVLAALSGDKEPGALIDSFTDTLCGLQQLAESFADRIHSVDINPVLIDGTRCLGVDSLVVWR
ncbi:MAG: acyl-CoA synthetase (NDP forming) [Alphaproteobacteria bacterium]|jgi:acyl-CoA synthetase (NDP forming)